MNKKSLIPGAKVSADTVGDLINQMRGENNGSGKGEHDEADAQTAANQPEKKSVIPKAVVSAETSSADTVGDLINQMRGENNGSGKGEHDEADAQTAANQPEKKSVIPKAVVSAEYTM